MEIQEYKPQYVLDVILYDETFYTVDFNGYESLKAVLNKEKFIELKGDLIATSSVKKVVKRQLTVKTDNSMKYQEMAKEPKVIPKELIEQAKQNAQKYKS